MTFATAAAAPKMLQVEVICQPRACNAEGVRGLVFFESEHARGSGGGTEDSGSAGDVPMRVMREPDGVGDAAFDFNARHKGQQKIRA